MSKIKMNVPQIDNEKKRIRVEKNVTNAENEKFPISVEADVILEQSAKKKRKKISDKNGVEVRILGGSVSKTDEESDVNALRNLDIEKIKKEKEGAKKRDFPIIPNFLKNPHFIPDSYITEMYEEKGLGVLIQKKNKASENFVKVVSKNPMLNSAKRMEINKYYRAAINIIQSMDIKEMLETFQYINMILVNEKLPEVQSIKVRKCIEQVIQLRKKDSLKCGIKYLQKNLVDEIIRKNRETADIEEGKRLYEKLMKKEE